MYFNLGFDVIRISLQTSTTVLFRMKSSGKLLTAGVYLSIV